MRWLECYQAAYQTKYSRLPPIAVAVSVEASAMARSTSGEIRVASERS
jgi:hypothetical protein